MHHARVWRARTSTDSVGHAVRERSKCRVIIHDNVLEMELSQLGAGSVVDGSYERKYL